MDKEKLKTMMYRAQKAPISELNSCITCKLCKGYFIDATTIIECLHTFCRSCIVQYLESNKYCPICDVQVHKTKPLLNIRRDKTIQDLAYKLVPRLYQNEAKRRKIFYEANPATKPSLFEENTALQYEYILAPDEAINLILNYYGCSNTPRYLRCPSAVSISHLKKLIKAKYELTEYHKVDVFYNQDVLNPLLSLMDIAYIYSWKKKEPLSLTYKIYECRTKKPKLDCTENGEGNVNKSTNNNNNNWKEVQLRISENGEMLITGIEDANMLELLDATENFNSEIVINESKNMDTHPKPVQIDTEIGNKEVKIQATQNLDNQSKITEENSKESLQDSCKDSPKEVPLVLENHISKKELPELKLIGKSISGTSSLSTNTKSLANAKLLNSGIKMVINNAKSGATLSKITGSPDPKKSTSALLISISTSTDSSPSLTTTPKSSRSSVTESKMPKITFNSAMPKSIELSDTLNLNSELSVIPLNASASCVSLSSCGGTTTVFTTINKSMCSTKSDECYTSRSPATNEGIKSKTTGDIDREVTLNTTAKDNNSLKRKCEEADKSAEIPAKLPKQTILNHSIGLMNLSNNHPLKKHSKMNRNGERRNPEMSEKVPISSPNFTVSRALVSQKPALLDNTACKPVIINKNLSYLQLSRSTGQKNSGNVPCYMPKMTTLNSIGGKVNEKNGEKIDASQEKAEGQVSTHSIIPKPLTPHSQSHTPIITPAQLPHHHNLNSLQLQPTATLNTKDIAQENSLQTPVSQASQDSKTSKTNPCNTQCSLAAEPLKVSQSDNYEESLLQQQATPVTDPVTVDASSSAASTTSCKLVAQNCPTLTSTTVNSISTTIKAKPSTPIGYKTLRDPPKSWNSQINSQIARVNQNVKAQQLANAAAAASQAGAANAQGRFGGGDLKSVRPAKFFKGRNMPRYLGNPASGVKPMYQVQVSPDKDKNQEQHTQNAKSEKSEIKKHSIVKIDPKTLKPISEKAPETSNLSNMSSSLGLNVAEQNDQELRINPSSGNLKINISSVSIFNPLKLQQNSPKNERKSPKSPHSPKVKSSPSTSSAAVTTSTSSNSTLPVNALSPKQQRDKNSLTFTPPNPFIPNLTSPNLNPNQFLYPAGGFPSYDPRFMAACHSLWYTQRMAAAAAAGLVPPPLPHAFGLNMGLNPPNTIGQQPHSPGVSSKHSTPAKATGQLFSRATSATIPSLSKSSPTHANKKIKESPAVKNEKSLVTALEKITQSKVKEMGGNKHIPNNKDIRNGSPSHVAQKTSSSNSPVTENRLVEPQQKKTATKDVGIGMSALEKLSQNKAIEILGAIRNVSGKRSPIVQEKDGRSSPMGVGRTKSGSSGNNRLTPVKDLVSAGRPPLPLTEQSTNSTEIAKSQPLSTSKKDLPKPDLSKTTEPPSVLNEAKKPLISKEQKLPDLKTIISLKDDAKTPTEIERRLGQPESNNQESCNKAKSSCSEEKNVIKPDVQNDDASSKSVTPSDNLDVIKRDSPNESTQILCTNSSENPGCLVVTSFMDGKNLYSEPSKCRSSDGDEKPIVNETSFPEVSSGTADALSAKNQSNDDVKPKTEDESSREVSYYVCTESDSGGGKNTNSVQVVECAASLILEDQGLVDDDGPKMKRRISNLIVSSCRGRKWQ